MLSTLLVFFTNCDIITAQLVSFVVYANKN